MQDTPRDDEKPTGKTLLRPFLQTLKVRPGEEGVTALLTLHSLAKGVAMVFLGTAAHALFLDLYSAEILPYAFVATAVVTALTGLVFRRLRERVTFPALMIGILVALVALVGTFQGLLEAKTSAILVFLLLILARLVYFVLDLEFWAMATSLLDVRQGKRLFGLIGTGESVARIVGAFSVPFLAPILGVPRLISFSLGGLVGCLAIQILTFRRYGSEIRIDDPAGEEERAQSRAGRSRLRRYVSLVSLLVFFGVLARYLVDYAFLHQTQARFGSAEEIAAFLGFFLGATQIISLLLRVFVSGRLISRFGVGVGLVVLPLFQLICTLAVILTSLAVGVGEAVFWLVVANQGLVKAIKDPIDSPSLKVLYQPLRAAERLAAQITIEMIVHPITTGIAGALMLAAIPYEPVTFGILLATTFSLWIVAIVPTYRAYSFALMEAVRKRTIDEGEVLVADRQSLDLLRGKLKSEHPGDVIFALDLLERVEDPELPAVMVEFLEHDQIRVRRHVIARLEVLEVPEALTTLRRRVVEAPDAEESREALRVLACREQPERVADLLERIDKEPPERRGSCASGLLRRADGLGQKKANEALWGLLEAPSPEERRAGARSVGELENEARAELLYRVLGDVDPEVRRTALAAAGRAYSPALWPAILDNMVTPAYCSAATTAVLVAGRVTVPQIDNALARIDLDSPVQRRLVRLCGRLRGKRALGVLRRMLHEPDQALRHQVLRSLSLCRYRAKSGKDRDDVRRELLREAGECTWRFAVLADLGEAETTEDLAIAFLREIDASRRRIFILLSYLFDPATLLGARDAYSHHSRDRRAYALEILDVVLPREIRPWLLPLFEDLEIRERMGSLDGAFPQEDKSIDDRLLEVLQAPVGQMTSWTRNCALVASGKLAISGLAEVLADRPDLEAIPLTRESRRWALAQVAADESHEGVSEMSMSTMEKVMVLKSVSIFADTSEDVLAEAAAYLEEVEIPDGDAVFHLGEVGDSMYIVIKGLVRCHIGDRVLNDLGEREIFGELAVLDPEPRSATVTALENTHLFRLGRDAFFELVADHVEVARGVFQVLCKRLRKATE